MTEGDARSQIQSDAPALAPPRMSRRRRFLFGLMTICSTLVASLLVTEVGLRMAGHSIGGWYSMPDSELSWVNKPLADVEARGIDYRYKVRINSQGFRGDELREADSTRIMMIGDSMVFGQGVDDHETFPSQLQVLLDSSGHSQFEVVNVGVYGYGSLQAKGLALRKWDMVKPDVVIFTHAGNDLADDLRFSKGLYRNLRNVIPGRQFLKEHSVLYNVARSPVLSLLSNLGVYNSRLRFEKQTEGGVVSDVGEEMDRAKEVFSESLREMKRICRDRKTRFFVTTVGFWSEEENFKFSSQSEWVKILCKESDIPFLEPSVAFPPGMTESLYNQNSGGHFTPLSNQLFAKSLYIGLKEAEVLR